MLYLEGLTLLLVLIFVGAKSTRWRMSAYISIQFCVALLLAYFGFSWVAVGHMMLVWITYFFIFYFSFMTPDIDLEKASRKRDQYKSLVVSFVFILGFSWILYSFNFHNIQTQRGVSSVYSLKSVGYLLVQDFFIPVVLLIFGCITALIGIGTLLERD